MSGPRSGKNFVDDRFFKHLFERIVFVGWYMTLDSGGAKNLDYNGDEVWCPNHCTPKMKCYTPAN